MTAWRIVLAIPAVAALAYAATRLADVPSDQWASVLTWLIGGVVLHDGVLAPLVVVSGVIASRWLPAPWRVPAVVGLIWWGCVSLIAIPVLTGYGVDPPNETLQHRPYVASWWIGTAVVVLLVVAAGWTRRLRSSRPRSPSHGGRTR
jgi:hypothetical protein